MNVTTDDACIAKMLYALPFADNDAGLPETRELIEKLQAERNHLHAALRRIATPEAFYLPTGSVDPETFARMIYAEAILDGLTLERAQQKAEYETRQRYPLRGTT